MAGSRICVVGVPCSGKTSLIGGIFPEDARVIDTRTFRTGSAGEVAYVKDLTRVMEINDHLQSHDQARLTVVETVPFYERFLAPFDVKLYVLPSDSALESNYRSRREESSTIDPNGCDLTTYLIVGNPQCGKSEIAERIVKAVCAEGRKLYVHTLPPTLPNLARISRHRAMRRGDRWDTVPWERLKSKARGSYSVILVDGAAQVVSSESDIEGLIEIAKEHTDVLILVVKGDPNDLVDDPAVRACALALEKAYPRFFTRPDEGFLCGDDVAIDGGEDIDE